MNKTALLLLAMATIARMACGQAAQFKPSQLAVLRAGDGSVKQHLKQAPIFIDQFDPKTFNAAPSYTVQIPTNGADSFFFNSHAATEGVLSRSLDHRLLVFAGYGGVNLLEKPGTPSLLDIQRGFCTVDSTGATHTLLYQPDASEDKINPRGAVSDGENHFWGCGNAGSTLYFNASDKTPMEFASVQNTRAMRIIAHALYTTLNGPDATAIDSQPGIYQFIDTSGNPLPLPQQAGAKIHLLVPVSDKFNKISGFDMNPEKTIAYLADTAEGVQKYVKSGDAWKLAYNFTIPQNIPAKENHAAGCFGLAVDFSGAAPIIYATTTEGYNGSVNSNRVVCIVDTNANATVTTIAQSPSVEIAFRGIDFTPEAGH